ncbi:hypothetical protein [Mesobacillus thioparans]|uniref:hypothetical protein n=1 Tax=Mesobacillus thioparans TaxID=370439 RepID=UPI0039F0FE6E
MKKRLIKKKVKRMNDNEICEHVAYGSRHWKHFAEKEFDKRLANERLSTKGWEEVFSA